VVRSDVAFGVGRHDAEADRRGVVVVAQALEVDARRERRRGVGVWDGARQLALVPSVVRGMLVALRDGGFADMPPSFGGRAGSPGSPAPDDDAALRVTCRIQVGFDGIDKQVVQFDEGEQSEALAHLANALYALAAPAVASGIGAVSLEDGLAKVGRGELARETLRASLHRKPELQAAGDARPAFLLHLEGCDARVQRFTPGAGYGPTRRLELGDGEIGELAALLAAHEPERFPANLWAPDYNDLSLAVLDHRVGVQARPFSGMTPTTHGDVQPDFDAVAEALARLAERVEREGELVEER
jgi:hypothetical protein